MAAKEQLSLKIEGMHCAGCVASIERGLASLPGIDTSSVNLAMRSAVVTFDKQRVDERTIINRIEELGYHASVGAPDILTSNANEVRDARQRFIIALILTVPLAFFAMWPMVNHHAMVITVFWDGVIQALAAAVVVLYAGWSIIADAARQTRHFRANMNSLIAMGTLTAFFWSLYALYRIYRGDQEPLYFDSAGMIITLILLGRYLESISRGRAGEAIQELLKLRPATARAYVNGVEIDLEPDMIRPGMTLLVRPGERIAADGTITEGIPTIDESMLTGESVPVEKQVGETVIGGSLNGNTPFKMNVTAAGSESYLAMVIRMVSEAQGKKAPVQHLADRVAGVFVPIVITLALITLFAWHFLAPDSPMAVKAFIAVLIISCPCALGLATPTAVLVGTGRAARAGILIRGGDILETLSKVDAVVFDKTGTLTHGRLEVVDMKIIDAIPRQRAFSLIGSIESQSEHPVAQAVARYLKEQEFLPVTLENVQAKPGFGMVAAYDNSRVVIGNRALMQAEHIQLGDQAGAAEAEMAKGRTVVFVALGSQVIGLVSLADNLREDAREAVTKLKPNLKKVAMLSGDNHITAGGVAKQLDIDFEAEVRPEHKKSVVEAYRKSGYTVAMVGDGINDAPALAAANVGVAVGTGTDIAIETADVVLLRPDLFAVKRMLTVARKTMQIIKGNLFWAFFYNVIAIPIAAGVLYPVLGWTLSPMIAAAAMAFSSLFVVLNSLRLNGVVLD